MIEIDDMDEIEIEADGSDQFFDENIDQESVSNTELDHDESDKQNGWFEKEQSVEDDTDDIDAFSSSVESQGEGVDQGLPSQEELQEWIVCSLDLDSQIEALLFASDRPLTAPRILELLRQNYSLDDVQQSIERIQAKNFGGFRLTEVSGAGFQYQTVAESSVVLSQMFAHQPRPLSRAALETLAIIAYRQPVTRAAIEFIRGVDSGSIVKNLLERELIRCVGRKEDVPGKPMVFGTTEKFLQVFSLNELSELPPIASFQTDSETMQTALKELEDIDKPVAIEDFIGDDSELVP